MSYTYYPHYVLQQEFISQISNLVPTYIIIQYDVQLDINVNVF
jgi:hypothetical protein